MNALSLNNYDETYLNSTLWGRLVENAVGAHLLNQLQGPMWGIRYWRSEGHEVDFVVSHGARIFAIEVKSGGVAPKTGLQHFKVRYPDAQILFIGENGIALEEFFTTPASVWFR